MTHPTGSGPTGSDDDPDRIPTQAELDAEDLAEIARTSRDADLLDRYPARPVDPGPAPTSLTRDARVAWVLAAVACAVWVLDGLLRLGDIKAAMSARLVEGLLPSLEKPTAQQVSDAVDKAHTLAGFWPVAFMVGIPVLTALTWPMLVWIAKGHSRNLRNVYLSTVVVIVLFVPVCADLMFNYPDLPRWAWGAAWAQAGLLVLSALMTLRRDVGRWLPPSMRMRPMRVVRGE